ncbi:MAG: hypothetical protein Unbinned8622contig1003_13 [Prokaryotic dsDNA virus sp.]|nr:MAG: hypothetical protein Unbinned8622contig1003_13 [Prokaryotic dsDNA virus sp.]
MVPLSVGFDSRHRHWVKKAQTFTSIKGRKASPPMNITTHSTKADILDASCELIDPQAEQIQQLKDQQTILLTLVTLLTALVIL